MRIINNTKLTVIPAQAGVQLEKPNVIPCKTTNKNYKKNSRHKNSYSNAWIPACARMTKRGVLGVTLIEMVIFIAIVSVAFTGIIMVFINTGKHSADPLVKIRTIELGQSFLEEILLKKYDEDSPVTGGCIDYASSRCSSGKNGSTTFQAEAGEARGTYDDVDDYHNLEYCGLNTTAGDPSCTGSCTTLVNESGGDISNEYSGYSVCVRVSFAGNELNNVSPGTGTTVLANDAKRIDVIITDPLSSSMTFTTYKLNF